MHRRMQRILSFTILVLFCLSIGKGVYYVRHGFNPRRIQNATVPVNLDAKTKQILSQPFRYLGRGRQCFAFVSSDGNYVLKLLRMDIYYPSFWIRAQPLSSLYQKTKAFRLRRYEFVKKSFLLACNQLKQETGSIALHLGELKRPHFPLPSEPHPETSQMKISSLQLTLIDSLGVIHHLPIEMATFALQYKHPSWTQEFLKALQGNDRQKAKKILNALLMNVIERGKKGILNKDQSFLRNYGFDGETAYQIDLGSFFVSREFDLPITFRKSVCDSIEPVQRWLSQIAPDLVDDFNENLNSMLLAHCPS